MGKVAMLHKYVIRIMTHTHVVANETYNIQDVWSDWLRDLRWARIKMVLHTGETGGVS